MVQSGLNVVIVGGGIGGLFAANALLAPGDAGRGLRAGAGDRRGRRRRVSHSQQRAASAADRTGPAVEKWGARVGHGSHYFRHDGAPIAPVQVTDSSGWNATFGMHRADLVEMLAGALPPGTVHTGHRATGFDQDGTARAGVVRQWRHRRGRYRRRRRRHPLRASSLMCLRHRSRCFQDRSPIGAWWRMSAFRIGRPTAGRCGSARAGTSSPSRCAPAS